MLDGYTFNLAIVVQTIFAFLSSVTTLLVSSEGRRNVKVIVTIHPNCAGSQTVRYLYGMIDVFGKNARSQSVFSF